VRSVPVASRAAARRFAFDSGADLDGGRESASPGASKYELIEGARDTSCTTETLTGFGAGVSTREYLTQAISNRSAWKMTEAIAGIAIPFSVCSFSMRWRFDSNRRPGVYKPWTPLFLPKFRSGCRPPCQNSGMSNYGSIPPPPPPPPSGTASSNPSTGSIDLVRAFGFVFEDPFWIRKILIGGLFYLLAFLLVGIPFVLGYCARLMRNVIRGEAKPLPEWDDLGEYFAEGLQLFLVWVVFLLPALVLGAIFIGGTVAASGFGLPEEIAGCSAGIFLLIFIPLFLVSAIIVPVALTRAIAEQRMGAAFEIGAVLRFIGQNLVNYLIVIVIYLIANFVAQFGIILFCIGIVLTSFWSLLITSYALADMYRVARVR